jgi:hypothetical protein
MVNGKYIVDNGSEQQIWTMVHIFCGNMVAASKKNEPTKEDKA